MKGLYSIPHAFSKSGRRACRPSLFSPHSIVAIAITKSHHTICVSTFIGGSGASGSSPVSRHTVPT